MRAVGAKLFFGVLGFLGLFNITNKPQLSMQQCVKNETPQPNEVYSGEVNQAHSTFKSQLMGAPGGGSVT